MSASTWMICQHSCLYGNFSRKTNLLIPLFPKYVCEDTYIFKFLLQLTALSDENYLALKWPWPRSAEYLLYTVLYISPLIVWISNSDLLCEYYITSSPEIIPGFGRLWKYYLYNFATCLYLKVSFFGKYGSHLAALLKIVIFCFQMLFSFICLSKRYTLVIFLILRFSSLPLWNSQSWTVRYLFTSLRELARIYSPRIHSFWLLSILTFIWFPKFIHISSILTALFSIALMVSIFSYQSLSFTSFNNF